MNICTHRENRNKTSPREHRQPLRTCTGKQSHIKRYASIRTIHPQWLSRSDAPPDRHELPARRAPHLQQRTSILKSQGTFDQAMQWLSRTIAVVIIMVGPGLVGAALDRRWGSSLCTPAGFLLGIVLATTALVVLAQKLAPAARGKPLPLEDPPSESEQQPDASQDASVAPPPTHTTRSNQTRDL